MVRPITSYFTRLRGATLLAGLPEAEREAAWEEIQRELSQYEGPNGFEGPCELIVAVAAK